jgi:hypothetical protein
LCLCSRRGAQREMARYLSVLTPSIPFCPLFHRFSVSLYRSRRPRPPLLLLPCLHSTSKSIRPPAKPLFLLFRKLSDALSRTTYTSTPSSPAEDFDSCLIHVSHTVIPGYRNFLVAFSPRSVAISTADISRREMHGRRGRRDGAGERLRTYF